MRLPVASSSPGIRIITVAGALLFFAAIGHFLFRYAIDFGRPFSGTPILPPLTWDVGLFTLFALHHSVFARTPLRVWLAHIAPPPLERSIYVWIASLLFLAVCKYWRPIPGVAWEVTGHTRWLLWGLQGTGLVLTLISAAVLDIRDLAGLTPMSGAAGDQGARAPAFKTSWPYGVVRHPIYAAWFLMLLPATPMTMTRLTFAVVSCTYLLVAMPLEEATLRRTSHGAYDEYMAQVKWKLIPGVY